MQLPASDELVLISGLPPIRAKKLRYFEDRNFTGRVLPPPAFETQMGAPTADDWTGQVRATDARLAAALARENGDQDGEEEGGLHRHPELAEPAMHPTRAPVDDLVQLLDDDLQTAGIGKPIRTTPLQRAHAMNGDPGRTDDDLVPNF
jgi:type IV secretion system protein VirD4